jgi:anthranilate synthase/aminodeoxychorismate synthase-like glutamine amidotransferase
MILIDNYDSFTYNIVQYLEELGIEPKIFENDKIAINELKNIDFKSIIISPGAGNPDTAGISMDVIKEFYKTKKILGICLGHQCIAQFFGYKIIKSPNPTHGKTSKIYFDETSKLFRALPQGFEVTRYHSLEVDKTIQNNLCKITAQAKDGTIMALEHKTLPIYGVQFHPEAILTQYGHELLQNFVDAC